MAMTRDQALQLAANQLETLIAGGDGPIFAEANGDRSRIVDAAMRARERLADKLLADEQRIETSLRVLIPRVRAIAAGYGPLHAAYEAIFDAEAWLAGKPTLLQGPDRIIVGELIEAVLSSTLARARGDSPTMTVAELIALLQRQDPQRRVVVKLDDGFDDVTCIVQQPIQPDLNPPNYWQGTHNHGDDGDEIAILIGSRYDELDFREIWKVGDRCWRRSDAAEGTVTAVTCCSIEVNFAGSHGVFDRLWFQLHPHGITTVFPK